MILNKKGMEIAISTVVTLIIGAFMVFVSIALFANFMSKTIDIEDQVSENMRAEVLKSFDDNSPLFILRSEQSPKKNEVLVFWVGIHNIYDETRLFNVSANWSGTFNDEPLYYGGAGVVAFLPGPYEIPAKGKEVIPLIVPTKYLGKGQHSVLVNLSINNTEAGNEFYVQYSRPRILYVKK